MIIPNTDVILLKVPLEMDDLNQLTFASKTAQFNYFNSLPKLALDDFTYQRKDNIIRVPELYDDILQYNYVMYRNTNYDDKWFYAFIEDMEYLNDNVTAVKIRTDTWQCWQFDLTFKPVLIDREHTNNDGVGVNTIPENLELGELVTNQGTVNFGPTIGELYNDYWIIIDVSMIQNKGESQTLEYHWTGTSHDPKPVVNGMPSGVYHLVAGIFSDGSNVSIKEVVDVYDNAGLGSAIQNIYILPKSLLTQVYTGLEIKSTSVTPTETTIISAEVGVLPESYTPTNVGTYQFTKRSSLNSYVPVNKKLLTFPYCYFNISNNAGTTIPFHYEDFSTNNVSFKIISALAPSGSVKAIPLSYKNIGANDTCFDYSITGAKYPMCAWINDSYTNWLTQNAVNMRTEITSALIAGGAGILIGSATGGVLGGVGATLRAGGDLIGLARQQHVAKSQANLIPDQARGNVNAGDIVWSENNCRFTYIPMCIKEEYASRIDQFFSQFGYKCNQVKVPNITGRRNWNYVKTIGCYIEADIPQKDLQEIKSMFDRGITLWHNPATFADYSQNNDII